MHGATAVGVFLFVQFGPAVAVSGVLHECLPWTTGIAGEGPVLALLLQPIEHPPEDLLLLPGGRVGQLDHERCIAPQVLGDARGCDDGKVTMPGEVHAHGPAAVEILAGLLQGWQQMPGDPGRAPGLALRLGPFGKVVVEDDAQDRPDFRHGALDPHGRDGGTVAVPWDDVQLLAHGGPARAVGGTDRLIPVALTVLRGRYAAHETDALVQSVGHRIVERDAHDLGALAVAPGAHVLDQLVECVFLAPVGGPHADAPAPDEQCRCGLQHVGDVLVQCRFVDVDQALQAVDVLRPG
ncbi:hypothetical protein D3C76_513890 [compost metagenome]